MRSTRRAFLLFYFLSCAAGLVYEGPWTRLLALQLGHTVAAASTVLAAFMGGLAIGAAAAGSSVAGRQSSVVSRQSSVVSRKSSVVSRKSSVVNRESPVVSRESSV